MNDVMSNILRAKRGFDRLWSISVTKDRIINVVRKALL